jgi:hypothetical protein
MFFVLGCLLLVSGVQAPPDLEATLRERLAAVVFVLPVHAEGEAIYPTLSGQLLPGRLPENLPFPVPVLPAARLIGSAVVTPTQDVLLVELVYEVDEDEHALLDRLEAMLRAHGFMPTENREGPGLTRRSAPRRTVQSRAFCATPDGPWLSVVTSPLEMGVIDLRIRYFSHPSAAFCTSSTAESL